MVRMWAQFFHASVAPTLAAGLSLARYGGTTVAADTFLDEFEKEFKSLLASIEIYRMRPANDHLLVSFKEEKDFLTVVRAASGVNIFLEIGWLFDSHFPSKSAIDSCFLKLQLSSGCDDERLTFLLDEIRSKAIE
jgi:hypothetical protein